MPRSERRVLRRAVVAATTLTLLSACTGGNEAGPAATTGPTYNPTGQIVVLSGRFQINVTALDAATDREREVALPVFARGTYASGWPGPDGRFYAMPLSFGQTTQNQMFLLGPRVRPQRIGPPVAGVTGFQVTAGRALTWGCPGDMQLLDLAAPTAWRTIGKACAASLSPDGRRVAYASHSALFVMDLPDGTPREVLRFRDLPELKESNVAPQSLDAVAWGAPGVAVAVGDASRSAIVVWREHGAPVVDSLGTAQLGTMQWQPGGRLLAFLEFLPAGEVFTFDPDTGDERQVGISRDAGQVSWAPDGKVLALARSLNVMALIDTQGRQVGTLTSSGVPLLWMQS
ncbi:MAG TPA: hypothetical protein VNN79_13575 [Actinomycetota bacterium]|nr:hypothetical protein [Actinomycetota bacterium]